VRIRNRKFAIAVGVLAAMLLISMELPYSDKAIIQYIIPVIKMKNSTLSLSGIIPLIGSLWCFKEIVKSKRFNTSGLIIFILLFFFILPVAARNINLIKTPIYNLNSGVRSIEVKDSSLSLSNEGEDVYLHIDVELKSYRNNLDGIKIGVILDDSLDEYLENNNYMIDKVYRLIPKESLRIAETLQVVFIDGIAYNTDFYHDFHDLDYKIVLMDDERTSILNRNDMY